MLQSEDSLAQSSFTWTLSRYMEHFHFTSKTETAEPENSKRVRMWREIFEMHLNVHFWSQTHFASVVWNYDNLMNCAF